MSKRAEESAIKAYPVVIEEHTERDLNKPRRLSCIKGYEQAEKDLALTWEDMKALDHIMNGVEFLNIQAENVGKELPYPDDEAFYGEILRCFNEQREKK